MPRPPYEDVDPKASQKQLERRRNILHNKLEIYQSVASGGDFRKTKAFLNQSGHLRIRPKLVGHPPKQRKRFLRRIEDAETGHKLYDRAITTKHAHLNVEDAKNRFNFLKDIKGNLNVRPKDKEDIRGIEVIPEPKQQQPTKPKPKEKQARKPKQPKKIPQVASGKVTKKTALREMKRLGKKVVSIKHK
jgi:hypothetical protein